MTNRQWLLEQMQNMSDEELRSFMKRNHSLCVFIKPCRGVDKNGDPTCEQCTLDWLKSEHKEQIKLSDAERVILENRDKEYKWICRDLDGELRVFEKKPIKIITAWGREENCFKRISEFNHLFQFIKWEDTEPYNIEELLKGE